MSLQERNERLFYRVLSDNIEELLPVVDLPTVGAYCQKHGLMFRSVPRGLYIGLEDKGTTTLKYLLGVGHPCECGLRGHDVLVVALRA